MDSLGWFYTLNSVKGAEEQVNNYRETNMFLDENRLDPKPSQTSGKTTFFFYQLFANIHQKVKVGKKLENSKVVITSH